MSQADFQKFMNSVQSDEAVRAALAERAGGGGSIPADELISLAGDHGYSFTVEEAQTELSDSALEGVAGGAGYLKIGDIKGESLSRAQAIKIDYLADTKSFSLNFIKFG